MKRERRPVRPIGGAPTKKCVECGEFFIVYNDTRTCPDCEGEQEDGVLDVVELMERAHR